MEIGTITEMKKVYNGLECRVDMGANMVETAFLYGTGGQFEYRMIDDEVAVQMASDETSDSGAENIIICVFRDTPDGLGTGETIVYSRDGGGLVSASIKCDSDGNITLNNGDDVAIKGNALNTWLTSSLSVSTAFGPSGPAIAPLTPNEKNITVKL